MGLCVGREKELVNLSTLSPLSPVASAFIAFHVDSSAVGEGVDILVASLTGDDFKTKIKGLTILPISNYKLLCAFVCVCLDSSTGERIDHLVNITLYLPLNETGLCDSDCRGCVDISAPPTATPSRHPQIPHSDFTFSTRVLQSVCVCVCVVINYDLCIYIGQRIYQTSQERANLARCSTAVN